MDHVKRLARLLVRQQSESMKLPPMTQSTESRFYHQCLIQQPIILFNNEVLI